MAKKVLLFIAGWSGHQPVEISQLLRQQLEDNGDHVDHITEPDALLSLNLTAYDLIVPMVTMSSITFEQEMALLQAVEQGTGVAGWHGSADSFRSNTYYQFMLGGHFVDHPGGGDVKYTINSTQSHDPIMHGIGDFQVISEQYYLHLDPGIEVLATTTFSGDPFPHIKGVSMPVVWKHRYGKGKVFYSSLGHNRTVFTQYPQTLTILLRGMDWAARDQE